MAETSILIWAKSLRADLIAQIETQEQRELPTSSDLEFLLKLRHRLAVIEKLIANCEPEES